MSTHPDNMPDPIAPPAAPDTPAAKTPEETLREPPVSFENDVTIGEDEQVELQEALMRHDPFAKEKPVKEEIAPEGKTATEGEPKPPQPATEPSQTPAQGEPTPPAAPAATPEPSQSPADVAALQALVQSQSMQIQAFLNGQTAQAAPGQPAPGVGAKPPAAAGDGPVAAAYDFSVPDVLVDAMMSQDKSQVKQALTNLVNGAAQAIHAQITPEFQSSLDNLAATNESREVNRDFYGKYATYDTPVMRAVVAEVGKAVTAERLALGQTVEWNAELRDTIATRVAAQVTAFGQPAVQTQVVPAPTTLPAPAPAPQPATPATFDGGSRGPVDSRSSEEIDIAQTLFG